MIADIYLFAVDSGELFVETYKALEKDAQQILQDIQTGNYDIIVDGRRYPAKEGRVSLTVKCPEGMTNHHDMACSK